MTTATFQEIFGFPPEASADAPGRVNLLGEHTDYNDGFMLPIAIPQRTHVLLARSHDGDSHFYSVQKPKLHPVSREGKNPGGFAGYIYGCIQLLLEKGFPLAPICLHIDSQVPIGAGLSSSAALEVAVLRGLRSLFMLDVNDVDIALLAQQAEIQYAHVNCGIMDQMASSLADQEHMLFLDARTLERKLLPLPIGTELLVIHSGVPRSLSESGYNRRRQECEEAAAILHVPALRDVGDEHDLAGLPPLLHQRVRHVVSENKRVLQALNAVDAIHFGQLMNASHASLRDDFEVSTEALDRLVELLQGNASVFGARLTGAGFGGACVALVRKGDAEPVAGKVLSRYHDYGYNGRRLV